MHLLGEWIIDPATRRISRGSEVARLSPKAMAVLTALRDARGRVLSRAELLDEVWPGVTVGEEVLTHAIAEIRKAFGDSARCPRYVETVHKSGYRLLVDRPVPAGSPAVVDLEHHAAYVEGSELFFRGGPRNVRLAADIFAGILNADPDHAPAYAGLAKSLFFLDRYFDGPADARERMEHCGRSAVALDPASPEAHAALGFVLTACGKYPDALASFAVSVKLNPHLAESHYLLGRACFAQGDHRIAATMLERAAALRSDDFHSLLLAAKARRFMGDEARSRANLVKAGHRIDVASGLNPHDGRALCDRICCMVELGDAAKAIEIALPLLSDPDPNHYYLACGLARAGEAGAALDCLETVVAAGWSHGAWLAHDHDLDGLRREPRFRRLAADLPPP